MAVWIKNTSFRLFSFPFMSVFGRETSSCMWILSSLFERLRSHPKDNNAQTQNRTRRDAQTKSALFWLRCCSLLVVHLGDSASCFSVSPSVSAFINITSHRQLSRRDTHGAPLHLSPPPPQNCTHVDSFCLIIQSRCSLHLTGSLPPSLSSPLPSFFHHSVAQISHTSVWEAGCRLHAVHVLIFPVRLLSPSLILSLSAQFGMWVRNLPVI